MSKIETGEITFVVDPPAHALGAEDTRFEQGRSYKLPLTSCDRWVRRGMAVLTADLDAERQAAEAKTKAEHAALVETLTADAAAKREAADRARATADALAVSAEAAKKAATSAKAADKESAALAADKAAQYHEEADAHATECEKAADDADAALKDVRGTA